MAKIKGGHRSHVSARRIYKVRWLADWLDTRTERIRRELGVVTQKDAGKKGEEK